jgi:hypothetical protein
MDIQSDRHPLMATEWQLAVWCLAAMALVPASSLLQPWWRGRLGDRPALLATPARWLAGLALPFATWISGAVPANYLGLYGVGGWLRWLLSAALLAGLWAGARWFVRRRSLRTPAYPMDWAVLDEPRWALYRAAGWLWVDGRGGGLLIGLALAFVEWSLLHAVWQPSNRARPDTCLDLARVATSALAFSLTGNLWLAIVFQLGLLNLTMNTPDSRSG